MTKKITEYYGREIQALSQSDKDAAHQEAFKYWRRKGFPYPEFSASIAARELDKLKAIGASELERVLNSPSSVGLRTANSLQPALWNVRVRGRSPFECFYHDASLRAIIERCVRLRPDRRCWSANEIRTFCGLYNRSRASNFRPTVAKAIYEKYSDHSSPVLDFSSGFGGRAFAAFAADRCYHAIDPESQHIEGIVKLKGITGGRLESKVGCAEDEMPSYSSGSFELIFTSPPYFNLEKYSKNPKQSYIRYPSLTNWLEGFLAPVLVEGYRLLTKGGYLVINIANTGRHPLADHFLDTARKVFGNHIRTHVMMLQSNPSYIARYGVSKRSEPIFVFRK